MVELVICSFSHLVELAIYTLVIRLFSHMLLFSHFFSHNHISHFVIVPKSLRVIEYLIFKRLDIVLVREMVLSLNFAFFL